MDKVVPIIGEAILLMSGPVNLLNETDQRHIRSLNLKMPEYNLPRPVRFCVHHTSEDKSSDISCTNQSDP